MIFPCQCTSRSTTFLYADICLQVTLVNSHVRCPKALKLISAYEMSNTFQLNLDWGFIKYCWLMALSFWTFTEGKKSPPTPSLSFRWIFMSYFLILLDLSVTNKGASLVAQLVKNLPAMWETRVWFLGWEDPWGRKCNPLQYSCLENPMDREAWQATVHGVARVVHDLVTTSPNQHQML